MTILLNQVTNVLFGTLKTVKLILQDLLISAPEGVGHSSIVELLMLVNRPKKWTLNGVIIVGVFPTLNDMTLRISNPKWRA